MTRKEKIREESTTAKISAGFGTGVSFSDGLVMGADRYDLGAQGSFGLVIPWDGCKHVKILVGDPS